MKNASSPLGWTNQDLWVCCWLLNFVYDQHLKLHPPHHLPAHTAVSHAKRKPPAQQPVPSVPGNLLLPSSLWLIAATLSAKGLEIRKSHLWNILLRTAPKSHVSQFCCLFHFSSLGRICLATKWLLRSLSLSRLSTLGTILFHVAESVTGRKQSSTEKCF